MESVFSVLSVLTARRPIGSATSWSTSSRVRLGAVSAEHGAGLCPRPEGLLRVRRQGARRSDAEGRARLHHRPQRSRNGVTTWCGSVTAAPGLSAATVKRRLAAVSSLFSYLVIRGDAGVSANPVPRGMSHVHPHQLRHTLATQRRSTGA